MSDHETIEMEPYAAPPPPPKRIQLSRAKGWRKPEGAIVVARPSRWGNPYRVVADESGWHVTLSRGSIVSLDGPLETRAEASEVAVEMYRALFPNDPAGAAAFVAELRGHDLACWCPLTDGDGNPWPCHADVLLELANR